MNLVIAFLPVAGIGVCTMCPMLHIFKLVGTFLWLK